MPDQVEEVLDAPFVAERAGHYAAVREDGGGYAMRPGVEGEHGFPLRRGQVVMGLAVDGHGAAVSLFSCVSVMDVPLYERLAAVRAKYRATGFVSDAATPTECSSVIGFLLDELDNEREQWGRRLRDMRDRIDDRLGETSGDGSGEPAAASQPRRLHGASAQANAHADLAALLQHARYLQSSAPDKARLGRAVADGALAPDDVRWVYRAAELVEHVVRGLEPGTLRDSGDLPDEPPLFTTRRLFQAVERRLAAVEAALGAQCPAPADDYPGLSEAGRIFAGLPQRLKAAEGD